MPVIATAGHVDHGKSTLIRALTGRDPDRWEEEQRRGMTIDLGFAWTDLGGRAVGFVDVPGHERFIKNMLAGIEGIDAALFVVAADEGWMPQSEEHLAVLDLIGVTRAIVALTRADLVDDETLALATLEVEEQLAGTALAGSPVIAVSAPTERGIEELRRALADAVTNAPSGDRPRMWIDRSFSIGGAGTVVTGTLTGGSFSVDDALVILPTDTTVRVRGLHSHEQALSTVGPGNRTAVNLAGVGRDEVTRGAMLGRPGQWGLTDRFVADLRTVRHLTEPVRDRGSFQVHIGSGAHPARLGLLEADSLDDHGAALITLRSPVPLATGDHLVVREVGRRSVVAGGVVLDPHPGPSRRTVHRTIGALRAATAPNDRAEALLTVRGVATAGDLTRDSGGGLARGAVSAGETMLSAQRAAELGQRAAEVVDHHHATYPLRPGLPLPELATLLGIGPDLAAALVTATPGMELEGSAVRLSGFGGGLGAATAAWEAARRVLIDARWAPPQRSELGLDRETIHALVRTGSLVAVSEEFVYLPETLEALEATMAGLAPGFTVGDFRDAMAITRKHAIPLLEWMDRMKITRRIGDGRELRARPPADSPPGDAPSR